MASKIINSDLEIHTTPLENIAMSDGRVIVTFDDIKEERWKVLFKTFQAIKITAIDFSSSQDFDLTNCFDTDGIFHKYILEILNSTWLDELKIKMSDKTSIVLESSKHFVFPFQENIFEIIADEFELIRD